MDHRQDRFFQINNELKSLNINNPIRISGVRLPVNDNTSTGSAIGCTMSHIKCLEYAKKENYPHVFICEDDFKCINKPMFLQQISKFETNHVADGILWDVLLIGGNNCSNYHINKHVDYCVQITNCQTTIGYVVNRNYYQTLIDNFKEGVTKLMSNPHNAREFALDIYWKLLQPIDRWFLIVPLTITQQESYSDIEKRTTNYDGLMLTLNKQVYFNHRLTKMN